jgi:DNA polymerase III subunit gamma/tau
VTGTTSGASGAYRVLARKYRPQTFDALIGQDALVRTLTNAFATGRIAQAYMLTGVRGIGKTTTARLIARALNYGGAPSIEMPDFTEHCAAILESRHVDVIEMDAASNTGVDNMREIIESVRYKPIAARTKVYIIDEVHMLSKSAFNALLKTLEEPPPHVKFVFATTEIRKVPVTVLSRCQRFDLKRLDAALLISHFQKICALETVEAEEEALRMIARAAEGSVRDGLSLLDQAIAYGDAKVKAGDVLAMLGLADRSRIIGLFESVMAGDAAGAIREIETQYEAGGDPHTILADLALFVHWVTRLKIVPEAKGDASKTETERVRGVEFAAKTSMAHLTRAWSLLLKGLDEVDRNAQPLLAAEMVLIRLAHAADLPSGEELARIARSGAPEARPSPAAAPMRAMPPAAPLQRAEGPLAVKAETIPAAMASEAAPRAFSSFKDIIALAAERRDVKLKGDLERLVRPIRVSPGQIELALEPGAPSGLPGELARKLEAWTGLRWMVLVARDGGERPAAAQARDAKDLLMREARADPDVQAVLKRFPGAEIVKVELPEAAMDAPHTDELDKDEA